MQLTLSICWNSISWWSDAQLSLHPPVLHRVLPPYSSTSSGSPDFGHFFLWKKQTPSTKMHEPISMRQVVRTKRPLVSEVKRRENKRRCSAVSSLWKPNRYVCSDNGAAEGLLRNQITTKQINNQQKVQETKFSSGAKLFFLFFREILTRSNKWIVKSS